MEWSGVAILQVIEVRENEHLISNYYLDSKHIFGIEILQTAFSFQYCKYPIYAVCTIVLFFKASKWLGLFYNTRLVESLLKFNLKKNIENYVSTMLLFFSIWHVLTTMNLALNVLNKCFLI